MLLWQAGNGSSLKRHPRNPPWRGWVSQQTWPPHWPVVYLTFRAPAPLLCETPFVLGTSACLDGLQRPLLCSHSVPIYGGCPQVVADLIERRCLHHNPKERPTAREVFTVLLKSYMAEVDGSSQEA